MNPSQNAAFASIVLAIVLPPSASAVDASREMWDQGGPACQLSVPTISSQVRPRATGMRNEGTSNEFVICQYTANSTSFTSAEIHVSSIDGANHSVQCTAMDGDIPQGTFYSTKSAGTGTGTTEYGVIGWGPGDFGATGTFPRLTFSVTCTLPHGASIVRVHANYDEYVGG